MINCNKLALVIEARDANNNVDQDFIEAVNDFTVIPATGTILDPLSEGQSFIAGILDFNPGFQFTGNGTNITMSIGTGPIAATSNLNMFNISASFESRILLDATFTEPTDIFFVTIDANDIDPVGNPGGDIVIARFIIYDGEPGPVPPPGPHYC